jgi:hypothetical protein
MSDSGSGMAWPYARFEELHREVERLTKDRADFMREGILAKTENAELRARVAEQDTLIERCGDLQASLYEEIAILKGQQAQPTVPKGWYIHRSSPARDDGGWAWSRDVAVVPAVAAQAFRALAWAIEHDQYPPREGEDPKP